MKEFDKWNMKQLRVIPPFEGERYYSLIDAERKIAWKAALEMIYYKGVLSNSLAGDLIKGELPDGSV